MQISLIIFFEDNNIQTLRAKYPQGLHFVVGVVGSLVGIASLIMGVDQLLKIGEVTIHGIINNESGMTLGSMYATMGVAIITCIGGMILAILVERYFKNELKAGTPFTKNENGVRR